jgi:hypothetical protein
VYGENLQCAVGLNHQLAVGSNLQLCVNPAGLIAGVKGLDNLPLHTEMLGSGIGGNMQLTIGTSASLVYGQAIDINLGPPKIELKGGSYADDNCSYIMCGIIGLSILTFTIVYGAFDSDNERAIETIVFQTYLDTCLAGLMGLEMEKRQADAKLEEARKAYFDAGHIPFEQFGLGDAFGSLGASAAVAGAAVAPLLVVAVKGVDR